MINDDPDGCVGDEGRVKALHEIDFEDKDWVQELRSAYGPYMLSLCEQGKLQEAAQTLNGIPCVAPQQRPTSAALKEVTGLLNWSA